MNGTAVASLKSRGNLPLLIESRRIDMGTANCILLALITDTEISCTLVFWFLREL